MQWVKGSVFWSFYNFDCFSTSEICTVHKDSQVLYSEVGEYYYP